jgi:signal transduction histidine kinase
MRRRRFDRRPEEVAAARRFVVSSLVRGSEAWETAQLLVSETVTSSLDQSGPDSGTGTLEVGYALDGGRLLVEVSDDGVGFDATADSEGYGLQSMAERIELVGGTLQVESRPGSGTTVTARVPVSPDAQGGTRCPQ